MPKFSFFGEDKVRFLIFLFFCGMLYANPLKCPIPYEIMYSIAKTEGYIYKKTGYPFIISFNKKSDFKRAFSILKGFNYKKLSSRTIDCYSNKNCVKIAKVLISKNIINIDMGAFQINYKYHRFKLNDYFNLNASYQRACDILYNLVKKYGWSWETIGKYHSFNKNLSKKYYLKVAQIYYGLKEE